MSKLDEQREETVRRLAAEERGNISLIRDHETTIDDIQMRIIKAHEKIGRLNAVNGIQSEEIKKLKNRIDELEAVCDTCERPYGDLDSFEVGNGASGYICAACYDDNIASAEAQREDR